MDFLKSTEFGGKLRNSEALKTLLGIMIETLAWPFMNKEILKSTIVLIFFLLKNLSVGVLINFVLIKKKV